MTTTRTDPGALPGLEALRRQRPPTAVDKAKAAGLGASTLRRRDDAPLQIGPSQDGAPWALEPHVCLICLGRVLSRALEPGRALYRCANCGATATGRPSVV